MFTFGSIVLGCLVVVAAVIWLMARNHEGSYLDADGFPQRDRHRDS
jgi:hypothetical protein